MKKYSCLLLILSGINFLYGMDDRQSDNSEMIRARDVNERSRALMKEAQICLLSGDCVKHSAAFDSLLAIIHADQGSSLAMRVQAQYYLGQMYFRGLGVPRNDEMALVYLRQALEQTGEGSAIQQQQRAKRLLNTILARKNGVEATASAEATQIHAVTTLSDLIKDLRLQSQSEKEQDSRKRKAKTQSDTEEETSEDTIYGLDDRQSVSQATSKVPTVPRKSTVPANQELARRNNARATLEDLAEVASQQSRMPEEQDSRKRKAETQISKHEDKRK